MGIRNKILVCVAILVLLSGTVVASSVVGIMPDFSEFKPKCPVVENSNTLIFLNLTLDDSKLSQEAIQNQGDIDMGSTQIDSEVEIYNPIYLSNKAQES
ncbi:MAG: hypothetical protein KAT65_23165 [Methanophagales archaeon]|nr:hypothetical protein [Methanophagales archaeon]